MCGEHQGAFGGRRIGAGCLVCLVSNGFNDKPIIIGIIVVGSTPLVGFWAVGFDKRAFRNRISFFRFWFSVHGWLVRSTVPDWTRWIGWLVAMVGGIHPPVRGPRRFFGLLFFSFFLFPLVPRTVLWYKQAQHPLREQNTRQANSRYLTVDI